MDRPPTPRRSLSFRQNRRSPKAIPSHAPCDLRTRRPAPALGCLTLVLQRNSRIRRISGIGIPTSHRRIGMACSFRLLESTAVSFVAPRSVPETATLGSGERGGECADEQRCREPERQLRGRLAGFIEVRLDLRRYFGDA